MTSAAQTPGKRSGRLAGALYLCLLPFGIFSFVYVPSVLLVRGDAAATARNILASERLFRAGSVSHLVSQVLVVFLALAMYRLLRSVDEHRARLMLVLALLCVPISFGSEVFGLGALQGLGGAGSPAGELRAQALLLLDMRRLGVTVAQVFWGLWLLPLGSLVWKSRLVPRWLAVPVVIAGVAYVVESGLQLLFPGSPTISQVTAMGELPLPLWLLFKGVRPGTADTG